MCNPLGFTFLIAYLIRRKSARIQDRAIFIECFFLIREKEAGVRKKRKHQTGRFWSVFVVVKLVPGVKNNNLFSLIIYNNYFRPPNVHAFCGDKGQGHTYLPRAWWILFVIMVIYKQGERIALFSVTVWQPRVNRSITNAKYSHVVNIYVGSVSVFISPKELKSDKSQLFTLKPFIM